MHLYSKCHSFLKTQLIPNNANLRLCLSASFFKAGFSSVSVVWRFTDFVHAKVIAAFVTRAQYLAETLLRKLRRGKRQ